MVVIVSIRFHEEIAMRLFAFILGFIALSGSAAAFECAGVKLPSSIVICSDPELMKLADERQQAFNEARWGLSPDQDQQLLADQTAWVRSYASACGVPPDRPAPMPVPATVRDCFANAAKARTAYLRAYRSSLAQGSTPAPSAAVNPPSPGTLGPSFDCSATKKPLALLLCTDPQLSLTDLRFGQAYYALFQSLDATDQALLHEEDLEFLDNVQEACDLPQSGPLTPQIWGERECVKAAYEKETALWIGRLSGPGLQEAVRLPQLHIALQQALQSLGFLSKIPVAGTYAQALEPR
jgi:uncharacterized protein